ncbi:phosphotransferase family protein [Sphingoaurantiacus capsulatus]|uniref:Phosphotransferase family protein n=1 Tax=Sphingoaurantiacus capsulatus TaxID=1771310 RepID=A0ABV7XD38_9SPHN
MDETQDKLTRLLRRETGEDVTVKKVTALTGGAASLTFGVEALRDGKPWRLIFQRDEAEESASVGGMTRAVQAALQMRAYEAGLPVAKVVAVPQAGDGLGQGFVMERIDGESLAPKYLRLPEYAAAREAMVGQCAAALAKLHAIPIAEVADLKLPVGSPADARAAMYDRYRSYGVDSPVFDLAFAWLVERLPADAPSALIHGDFRSGNFLVGEGGLTAILDWELAQIGHPMEDIGWLSTNTWRFGEWQKPIGGFGERDAFYEAYAAAGGRVDRSLARVFELWGSLRWGVMCLQLAHSHMSGVRRSVEMAAIGRRVSETEIDILHILKQGEV